MRMAPRLTVPLLILSAAAFVVALVLFGQRPSAVVEPSATQLLGSTSPAATASTSPATQPSSPGGTPPPLNAREVKVIGALAKLGITAQRAQIPFQEASVWADFGAGRHFFVSAYSLGVVDRNYTVLDERQVGGTRIQHVQRSSGTISSRFECSGDEYWVNGADPPGFQNMDVFVERFIGVLGCPA